MDRLRLALARIRGLFGRSGRDQNLNDEIAHHLELETRQRIAAGVAPDEAQRQARLAFGPIEAMKEMHRDGRGIIWLEEFVGDLRYAFRALRRAPILGGAAIITLAIGIGANTAIYSAVDAVILRPLPFNDPDRLVMLTEENVDRGWHLNVAAPANYLDWKDQVAAFKDVAAYIPYFDTVTLTGQGEPRAIDGATVTGNFFSVLGVRAARGRTFTDQETWSGGTIVAIISDRLWRTQFGADPAVVGRTVQLAGTGAEIVGIMPPGFTYPSASTDVWVPTGWNRDNRSQVFFRRAHFIRPIARLKPGVTAHEANAQLQVVVQRLQQQYPATNTHMGAALLPLHDFIVGTTRQPLIVLLAAVGLLLLIACANVGNLMLIQAAGRGRETALRLALGARRGRLVRQGLAENLLLSVTGGAVGLALGWWGTHALAALIPSGMLPVDDISVRWPVVGYVIAITLGSGVIFGMAPILWTLRRVPGDALKEGGRGAGTSQRMRRWGRFIVVAEVALALLLSIGAGLLVRSFQRLERVNPGFDPDGVLAISTNIPGTRYDTATKISAFYRTVLQQVSAIPDVRSAAVTTSLPLTGGVGWTSDFTAAGRGPDGYGTEVAHRSVSPDYFRTMHVPIIRGRGFTPADRFDGAQVVVINEALARSYFRGENPVGQRIAFDRIPDSNSVWRTVVGVVGDERQAALATASQIELITPEQQAPSTFMNLMVRTGHDPMAVAGSIRRVVAGIDPSIAFTSVQTMDDVRDQSLAQARFLMTLLFAFAGAGLLLGAVGVYGVMAHAARGRTREMGIRVALGAQRPAVRWLVLREGLLLTAAGVALGVAAALVACRAMTALLYQVAASDPVTFLVVPSVLACTALMATWLPAARAARADPMESLRAE
ncbi:MAG TPA: ABC transporter permease [Gemmatimonadales bacterium]|jgi:putative ABC transport system permease protein